MRSSSKQHTPELRTVLRTLQIVAGCGLLYSMTTLARTSTPNVELRDALYITWFSIAIISVEAILHWIKAGVYALLAMTVVVTIADVTEGVASIGGASLGLLIVVILVGYLYPVRDMFE